MKEVESAIQVDIEPASKKGKYLSERSLENRKSIPTAFADGKIQLSDRVAGSRRKETYQAALEIHSGGTLGKSAEIGLLDAVNARCSTATLVEVLSTSNKFTKSVLPQFYKASLKTFEGSEENMLRSVAVYYGGGIMGKRKYRKVYRAVSYQKADKSKKKNGKRIAVGNCPIPLLVPYNKLMPFIKNINIGTIYSVSDTLCNGIAEVDKVQGCYRSLKELLIALAEFYLSNAIDLVWFDEANKFYVSLGGDGAPFGKYDTACAWLVSFLNLGKGILSSNENYLLFGANCGENSIAVIRFIKQLMVEIAHVEKQIFPINVNGTVVKVKFCIAELPNDMKMLAFLAGELSNSAKYFSTFANVCTDNYKDISGTFGEGASDIWKPWKYSERLTVAKTVDVMKKKVEKQNCKPATKRSKITAFIGQKHSRQEFVPLVGKLIDQAHVDPLHLKNNACALAHRYLLNEILAISNLSNSILFSQVPASSPFGKYIMTMKHKCNLSRLANQIVRWFNETKTAGKEFEYRFTGKDSRLFLQNFMLLISSVESDAKKGTREELILHILAYICLCLRDCVSIFTRVVISEDDITKVKQHCSSYYKAHCLFLHVNPTVWTLGNVVPHHMREMKTRYGMGLGLNSMEGREAKHVFIGKYSQNTIYQYRWQQIFRHEYVTLIWLRTRGLNISKPTNSNATYIPKKVFNDQTVCYCGLSKLASVNKCRFCNHSFREKIKNSVLQGKSLIGGLN